MLFALIKAVVESDSYKAMTGKRYTPNFKHIVYMLGMQDPNLKT